MTTADRLRAEGAAEGEARGEARGDAKILLRQLRAKFDGLPAWAIEKVKTAATDQLEAWSDRVLIQDISLQEFFAH